MKRSILAVGLVSVAIAVPELAIGARASVINVTDRSVEVNVAPEDIADGTARCPRGYLATGGSVAHGATDPVFEGPDGTGRGWAASASNFNAHGETYGFNIYVVCAKGTRGVTLRASSVAHDHAERLAEARAKAANRAP